jgi:FixJ family two-component response regulator
MKICDRRVTKELRVKSRPPRTAPKRARYRGFSILPNRKSVIVVDDDPDMLRGLHRLLRQYGFKVAPFDSIESFQKRADLDAAFCIVLDVNLGDGSGIELSQRLSERGASLPIIFITGNDSDATRNAALQSGCAAYLTKPFPAQSLLEPIRRALALLSDIGLP